MLEKIFKILGVIGFVVICILSFIIPSNPLDIVVKGVNYDYPMFLCIIVFGGLLYSIILYGIYLLINTIYKKYLNKNNRI